MIRNVVMREPGLYEILGMVRIATFGAYIWVTEDLDGPGAGGAIFRCYEDGNDQELAYLLVADVSQDPTEPDMEKLRPQDVEQVDRLLEDGIRRGLPAEGRKMIRWITSELQETDAGNWLWSSYIAEDQGRERHYMDCRMPVAGRKWIVSGCFDVARAGDFSQTIFDALQNVSVRVRHAH